MQMRSFQLDPEELEDGNQKTDSASWGFPGVLNR